MRSHAATLGGRAALALLAIVWSAVGSAFGQEPADGQGPHAAGLFGSNEQLNLQLSADFGAIAKERGTTKHDHPGVLRYVGPSGDTVAIDVRLHTRGHFRLRTCEFPPLKIEFPRDTTAHTLFSQQKSVKLVVQCRKGQAWANYLLGECLIYRTYNLLTDLGFRVRLAAVTHVNPGKKDRPETR